MKRTAIFVSLLLVAVLATGCGGSGKVVKSQPEKSTSPGSAPEPSSVVVAADLAGPWVVSGQPEDQYYLTFRPEGTYGMRSAGAASEGIFMISGENVTLIDTKGNQVKYRYVKGAEMMQDRLEGQITWTRV
ncbi:MAG: hypothetical protein KKF41_03950 [Actinobacteria bacterium]|nr:hypothetical protein [Actinomycetota bacterium]MBU1944120.1 hypothetical protein [Actinomycetota bacterium]MBU2686719.1 hypothetical protein [Actinomycetota bacterium]